MCSSSRSGEHSSLQAPVCSWRLLKYVSLLSLLRTSTTHPTMSQGAASLCAFESIHPSIVLLFLLNAVVWQGSLGCFTAPLFWLVWLRQLQPVFEPVGSQPHSVPCKH